MALILKLKYGEVENKLVGSFGIDQKTNTILLSCSKNSVLSLYRLNDVFINGINNQETICTTKSNSFNDQSIEKIVFSTDYFPVNIDLQNKQQTIIRRQGNAANIELNIIRDFYLNSDHGNINLAAIVLGNQNIEIISVSLDKIQLFYSIISENPYQAIVDIIFEGNDSIYIGNSSNEILKYKILSDLKPQKVLKLEETFFFKSISKMSISLSNKYKRSIDSEYIIIDEFSHIEIKENGIFFCRSKVVLSSYPIKKKAICFDVFKANESLLLVLYLAKKLLLLEISQNLIQEKLAIDEFKSDIIFIRFVNNYSFIALNENGKSFLIIFED